MLQEKRIVVKWGGACMRNLSSVKKACEITLSDQRRSIVVVSAPGKDDEYDKMTNVLIHLHRDDHPEKSRSEMLNEIEARFAQLATGTKFNAKREVEKLGRDLADGSSFDFIVSRGEYLMAKIMSEHLGFTFVDASTFVRFDAEGRLNLQETLERAALLCKLPNAIIPGFYGQAFDGSVKLMTRGGTDLTKTLVAAGVKAEKCENWKDVTGVKMADPRIVKNPRTIKVLSTKEMRELSYMGFEVLHEEAVLPLRGKNIPIEVRNMWLPEEKGTLVVDDAYLPEHRNGAVIGIAGKKDFSIIRLEKRLMNQELGFLHRATGVFATHAVNIEHVPGGIDTVSFLVRSENLKGKFPALLKDLEQTCEPDEVCIGHNIALISVVGSGMTNTPGILARASGALAWCGINIRIVDQGSSELSIIIGIDNDDYEAAIRALYAEFTDSWMKRLFKKAWWFVKKSLRPARKRRPFSFHLYKTNWPPHSSGRPV
jgi:aspartate kinase